ncbi:hypothetical protein SAMN04487911_12215 [Arenibacter nanhaiticus]|uniref:Uncharacterized protein n=1 Tax=Arenibacter nanhaiticus TaxID=558155 RepID=A0A1M6JIR3_9FLAO|nr:hypothetical protein [Arenibacter nanhaiticus]SHJ46502.1 hypothetical protein SAMN04487911_12215 [Arenibacter nanhaiticus]
MKKLVISLISLCTLGCDKDTQENILGDPTSIDIVTGMHIRSSRNSAPILLGNPNSNNKDNFIAFPNPPIGTLYISATSKISNVWIIPSMAKKSFQEIGFSEILTSDIYTENEIDSRSELRFPDQNATEIALPLERLKVGYYKVFIKKNDTLYWDNIYVSDGSIGIEKLIDSWK